MHAAEEDGVDPQFLLLKAVAALSCTTYSKREVHRVSLYEGQGLCLASAW